MLFAQVPETSGCTVTSSLFSWLEFQLFGSETSSPGQAPPARLDAAQQGSGVKLRVLGTTTWLLLVYNQV